MWTITPCFRVRELIDLYQPDFIYFDGEWDNPPEFWKSRELVSYYYNQAESRGQKVLINDRYGKGARGVHGDVFNVEYHFENQNEGQPGSTNGLSGAESGKRSAIIWTQTRRTALPQRSLSTWLWTVWLATAISISMWGPTEPGEITAVEREPLEHLGNWLKVNGESIYGTRPWKVTSEGDIRFTCRDGFVYAVFLKWPGDKFVIKSLRAAPGSKISMLGIPGELEWTQNEQGLAGQFPRL